MHCREKSTEWALLFPLKAGLFAVKSSISSRSLSRDKADKPRERVICKNTKIRRGSSLSDLDKLQTKILLPNIIGSTEKCSESLPQSPALSRTNLQLSSSQVRGSIGDLMNLKKYGSSTWSVRSETLITKFVPLSTVTPRHSPPMDISGVVEHDDGDGSGEDDDADEEPVESRETLTCAQRTQRLSKLIKKQRQISVFSPSTLKKLAVSTTFSCSSLINNSISIFSISY
ncbi:uncharacterized protein [Chelonus insularis]|uniref:uncharacterized protein n=1 Tax=Chelonus insularis TaxID=460826 RepID=UPI00158A0895|nr:uncharacterized protein LOC118071366 [Chelonus insularis]